MGGCCARQQEVYFDKKNCFNYSTDEVIKINAIVKPELKLERKKENVKEEEIQLGKIIIELKKIFKEKVDTISEIELFNLAIYNKESFINNDYLIFDMRKSSEQKEEYLKRIRHINYTYDQVQKIEKINKLQILHNFINNKIIILIIPEYYLNPKNNKEGFRKVETYPIELCHLLDQINNFTIKNIFITYITNINHFFFKIIYDNIIFYFCYNTYYNNNNKKPAIIFYIVIFKVFNIKVT